MTWLRVGIVASWLAVLGWFLRYEAYPEFFTNTLEGYRDVLSEGQLFVDSWMKILFKDNPIGLSHTSVEVIDDSPTEHFRLSNRTHLSLNLMGQPQTVSLLSVAALDMLYHLQRFEFSMTTRHYAMRIEGRRQAGTQYRVIVRSDMGSSVVMMDIPDDVVLYSPLMEMSMSKLKPGEFLHVRTLDPASMALGDVLIRALRRERITVAGVPQDALALSVEYQGVDIPTWIDAEGHILRQTTALGWTMESCTQEEAMSLKYSADSGEDLLLAASVPCEGGIQDAETARSIRLRVSGAPLDGLALESSRQTLLSTTGTVAEVELRPAAWPSETRIETNAAAYLAASQFVQADHPDIVSRADKITAGLTTPRDKALAIYEWVYKSVSKKPTVSLPSALDVLHRLEGDCNEHTYLFVALARAAHIPAQIRVGLLYVDGRFYYHAWPAVYVGDWVEMDPTKGQPLADAGHLSLLEGELANQMRLFSVLGRLRTQVLAQTY